MNLSREAILNIALEIERKGIEFYQRAREQIGAGLADDLIRQEREHIRIFQDLFGKDRGRIRQEVLPASRLDDDYLAAAYAGTEVFAAVDPATVSRSELLDVAIAMEKSSILFYGELMDELHGAFPAAADLVRKVQEEEKRHLMQFARLKGSATA